MIVLACQAVFKSLQLQMKENGMAWWACLSCLSFSHKINAQFKNISHKMEYMDAKITGNAENINKTRKEVDKLDGCLKRVERKG